MRSETRRTLAEIIIVAFLILLFMVDWFYISKICFNDCITTCESYKDCRTLCD